MKSHELMVITDKNDVVCLLMSPLMSPLSYYHPIVHLLNLFKGEKVCQPNALIQEGGSLKSWIGMVMAK